LLLKSKKTIDNKEEEKEFKQSIEDAKIKNAVTGKFGDVKVNKLPHFRSRNGIDKKYLL